MSDFDIYLKLTGLPDHLKNEVSNYLDFLKTKAASKKKKRKAGLAKGLIKMKAGFDKPLDDFKNYMQ